jgi:hypothetical protein
MKHTITSIKLFSSVLLIALFFTTTQSVFAMDVEIADKIVPSNACQGALSTDTDLAGAFNKTRQPLGIVQLIKDRLHSGILCTDPEYFAKELKLSGVQWRINNLPKVERHMSFGTQEMYTPKDGASMSEYLKLNAWYADYPGSISWFFAGNTLHEKINSSIAKLFHRDELDIILGKAHRIYQVRVGVFGNQDRLDYSAIWITWDKYAFVANYTSAGDVYMFEFHTHPKERMDFLDRDPRSKRLVSYE